MSCYIGWKMSMPRDVEGFWQSNGSALGGINEDGLTDDELRKAPRGQHQEDLSTGTPNARITTTTV